MIYDLENKTLVENGLSDVSYSGVVHGYFESNELSDELRTKFEQYQKLTQKKNVTDEELAEIARLEMYLDEVPDYLIPEVSNLTGVIFSCPAQIAIRLKTRRSMMQEL